MTRRFLPTKSFTSVLGLTAALTASGCASTYAGGPTDYEQPYIVAQAPDAGVYGPIGQGAPQTVYQQVSDEPQLGPQPDPVGPQDSAPAFTAAQLKELVAPIALYPDPLLAQVLAASTYPLDIVQAGRFIKASEGVPALLDKIDEQPWDPSVKALARYPSVLKLLDENLAWTQSLGAAFMQQQTEVMNAIQACRLDAQAAGNLQSTPQQQVVVVERVVQIIPANPEVIYVPVYEPDVVYVERPPTYFGNVISFSIGFSTGYWLNLDCDWGHRRVLYGGRYHVPDNHRYVPERRPTFVQGPDRRYDDRVHHSHDVIGAAWQHDRTKPAPQVRPTQQWTHSDRNDGSYHGDHGDRSSHAAPTPSTWNHQGRPDDDRFRGVVRSSTRPTTPVQPSNRSAPDPRDNSARSRANPSPAPATGPVPAPTPSNDRRFVGPQVSPTPAPAPTPAPVARNDHGNDSPRLRPDLHRDNETRTAIERPQPVAPTIRSTPPSPQVRSIPNVPPSAVSPNYGPQPRWTPPATPREAPQAQRPTTPDRRTTPQPAPSPAERRSFEPALTRPSAPVTQVAPAPSPLSQRSREPRVIPTPTPREQPAPAPRVQPAPRPAPPVRTERTQPVQPRQERAQPAPERRRDDSSREARSSRSDSSSSRESSRSRSRR